jgi:hypothetical protein
VLGSGFTSGSKVQWNGTDRTTTYVSAKERIHHGYEPEQHRRQQQCQRYRRLIERRIEYQDDQHRGAVGRRNRLPDRSAT